MELNEAIYTYLSAYTALTALVGKRIYPDKLPDKCPLPAIAYQLVSESETETFTQPEIDLIASTYAFSVYASTRGDADSVSKKIRAAFKNYHGTMGGAGGVTISAIRKIPPRITDVDLTSEGAVIVYKDIQNFEIWYNE
jgi:hypothetical protein